MTVALLLTAAGSSMRMGLGKKKEFLTMQSIIHPNVYGTVLSCSAEAFLSSFPYVYKTAITSNKLDLTHIIITMPEGQKENTYKALFASSKIPQIIHEKNITLILVPGGKTRQESVYEGLKTLDRLNFSGIVLVHDAARPFVTSDLIQSVTKTVIDHEAAVPAIRPTDTQKEIDQTGKIIHHLNRNKLAAVQTPQGFIFKKLLEAHKKASTDKHAYTDDTEIWQNYCGSVFTCLGSEKNIKITYKSDLKALDTPKKNNRIIRTGLGYDLHQLIEKRPLMIGGIEIPSDKGEKGHSDGDALLHAITDALLGASASGDIGELFPPSDDTWKDANSLELLKIVWNRIKTDGWQLENIDCVIALQKPKFLPYRTIIREKIAHILEIDVQQIFVKAKTGEHLGPVGTSQAIEVWATCLLSK